MNDTGEAGRSIEAYKASQEYKLARQLGESALDLYEAKSTLHETKQLAEKDPLTGLDNRRAFTQKALDLLKTYDRLDNPNDTFLVLTLIDLDFFKQVNDTYGHDAGDEVLVETAHRIKTGFRSTDNKARWGGEEFTQCGLAPETTAQKIKNKFNQIRTDITNDPIRISGKQGVADINVTHSWGLVIIDQQGMEHLMRNSGLTHKDEAYFPKLLEAITREADRFLYEAKQAGRNRLCTRMITEKTLADHAKSDLPHHSESPDGPQ